MSRRRYSIDEKQIERFRKEGRGEGHGPDYRPWLNIGDVASRGRSHRLRGIKSGHVHHLLSDVECSFLFILDWSDRVTDIRECYPLKREVTQRIAAELGIRHPIDIPSRTPLVMTTDFLVDVVQDGRLTLMARAVKRSAELDKRSRARETRNRAALLARAGGGLAHRDRAGVTKSGRRQYCLAARLWLA